MSKITVLLVDDHEGFINAALRHRRRSGASERRGMSRVETTNDISECDRIAAARAASMESSPENASASFQASGMSSRPSRRTNTIAGAKA